MANSRQSRAPRRGKRTTRGASARRRQAKDSSRGSRRNRARTKEITARKRSALQPSRELDSSNAKSNNNPFGVIGQAKKKKRGS